MAKLTNDQNFKNYRKRKILLYVIVVLSFITIGFGIAALTVSDIKSYCFTGIGLVTFLINTIVIRVRDNIEVELSEENKKAKEERLNRMKKKKIKK